MANTEDKQLKNLIDAGRYFSEAWNWYANRYLKQAIERTWLLVLAIVSVVILTIHFFATQTFFPLAKPVPFVMYVENEGDDLHVIKRLTDSETNEPQIALAKYLVSHYVKLREEYDYDNIEQQKAHVKANSSRLVYDSFINYLDTSINLNSPLLKYKRDVKREIEILDVKIYGSGNSDAEVRFVDYDNLTKTRKEYNVMLRFTLSNLVPAVMKLVPLEFRVVSYGK